MSRRELIERIEDLQDRLTEARKKKGIDEFDKMVVQSVPHFEVYGTELLNAFRDVGMSTVGVMGKAVKRGLIKITYKGRSALGTDHSIKLTKKGERIRQQLHRRKYNY